MKNDTMMSATIFSVVILVVSLSLCLTGVIYGAQETAASTPVLTFEKFCSRVLAYYPKLKREGASVEIAIARKFQAVAGYLPHVQGLASMTTSNDQVYVFGTLLKQRAFTQEDFSLSRLNNPSSRTNYNIGIHAEMPIFDALQTVYRVKAAKYMVESARYDELFSRMEAILVATDTYLHAIATDKLLHVVDEACARSEEDLKQADELKQKGLVLGADYYAAKITFGGLKSMKNELAGRRAALAALLNILMGEDPLKPVDISDEIGDNPVNAGMLADWLSEAYAARPDLRSIEEAIHAKETDYLRERMSALPKISAFGDLNENTQNFNTGGGSFAVGLKGSVDILEPDYFARVKLAKESLKKLKYDRDIIKDAIAKEVTGEYARFEAIRTNLPILREMKSDANEAVSLTLPLYREGRKSIADLLDMRRAYVETNQSYYASVAGSGASWASLLFLSGRLDETTVRTILKNGE